MDRRSELLQIERARWNEFRALIDRIPTDRMLETTLNADGWSVRDLLWHMRCWDIEIAHELERIGRGTYVEHDDDTDGKNERFLAEGRQVDQETAMRQWLTAREGALEQMAGLPEITPPVEEWFSELAYKHMDDHLPELRRFGEHFDSA
jgi:mycothiol maleylpyruvate isomerase-like protein